MSAIFALVCRAMLEIPVRLRVRAGRKAWEIRSAMVTCPASIPMGTPRPMGNSPRWTEKIKSSTRPIQKEGVLAVTIQYPVISRSGHFPLKAPARIPSIRPKTPDRTQAEAISHRELKKRSPTTWATGLR